MVKPPNILIIDLGSQFTLLIKRTLQELGFRSVVLNPGRAAPWIAKHPDLQAVILSGGPASVYEKDAPRPPEGILELRRADGSFAPVLGICYGMQWMVQEMGGSVEQNATHREYGRSQILLNGGSAACRLFLDTPDSQEVWASHGDSVSQLPSSMMVVAQNRQNGIVACMSNDRRLIGVQFHPEVQHTPFGAKMLDNFAHQISGCKQDWIPSSLVDDIRGHALETLAGKKAVIGFSGGVDSCTNAAILAPVMKKDLLAVTIDAGNLREGEVDEICEHARIIGLQHLVLSLKHHFVPAVGSTTDAGKKREIFSKIYEEILCRSARNFGAMGVVQGSLAPDRIESGATGGAVIKRHHNVGGEYPGLIQLHVLGELFKDEVRTLARDALNLPERIWRRHPFPGPGLFLRLIGVAATPESLEIARWADARTKDILVHHEILNRLSQYLVGFAALQTVGVKGDAPVYSGMALVRAVETNDFMTARGSYFPEDVAREINRTLTKHPNIVRALFDPTDKPPATTEFE